MSATTGEASQLRGVRRTLLHRPEPPLDSLLRSRLSADLDAALMLPACTVCAPAGFGKSVAVSQWCESLDRPSVWLSLDRAVDDPQSFVVHLVAAVRQAYPEAFPLMSQITNATGLPALETVIVELSNEFDELSGPVVVVLDDFHLLTSPECVEIVAALLRHPSESVHFVLVSRHEPSSPILTQRAAGRLGAVRMDELAFTRDEIEGFARQQLGRGLAPDRVDALQRSTEGWPAGVRLAVEALRHSSGDAPVVGAGFLDAAAQEYLLNGVLDNTPAEVRGHLSAMSLFDQFNAELCDAVAAVATDGQRLMAGADFIRWMTRNGMFIVALDPDGEWFRFHHLFAQLLDGWRTASESELDPPEAEIRRIAAGVFRAHGMFERAVEQSYLAGDTAMVARIATACGAELIEQERWRELDRLLDRVPPEVLETDAELLVLRAWWLGHTQARFHEMSAALSSAETLLDGTDEESSAYLRGQIAALRAAYEKVPSGDLDGAIDEADTACQLLATTPGRHLAFAYLIATIARVVTGRFADAERIAHSVFGDERFAGSHNDPMIWAMPYLGWDQGDLAVTERYGSQLHDIGQRFDLHDAIPGAAFFLGRAAYERNQLAVAESHLRRVVDLRFSTRPLFLVHSWIALAFTQLAQGRRRDADATASSMMQFVLAIRSEIMQPVAEAFIAELDLRQGRSASALRWARSADPDALGSGLPLFFEPGPTLVEVLLSSDSDADIARGRGLLDRYCELAERHHRHPTTVRLLGLRALDLATRGDEDAALETLRTAVTMSQHSGMIRRLADLGPPLAPLLHRLDVAGDVLTHVGAILAALEPVGAAEPDAPSDTVRAVARIAGEPALTNRELDVLEMLADRKSNKEIARELLIAPATVKKHTVTLYEKLNVHGRQEAVTKARALGYLPN